MISKRKDPDVLDTSKPILEPPVYPTFPENTRKGTMPKDDPELFRKSDKDDNDDVTAELDNSKPEKPDEE